MKTFTPGPYFVDDRGEDIGADIRAAMNSNAPSRIANVVPFKNYRETARLISAAPEMLGALKAYEKAMRGSPAEQPNLLWLIEALHKADAAIRKAEEGA